ncbi:hypothetical protein ACQJ6K_04165, partial [Helicobacter pylori]
NKTESLEAITQAKTTANNEISENKTQAISNITQQKQQAYSEITEAKKTAFNELLETLKPKFSGLFVGAYYINNAIYIQDGRKAKKESEILDWEIDEDLFCTKFRVTLQKCEENEHDK